MTEQRLSPSQRLNVLVVEDDDESRETYIKAFKRHCKCKSELWLNILPAANETKARETLLTTVCPFLSLDQKIPMTEGDDASDRNGINVAMLARETQPLKQGCVYTINAQLKEGIEITKLGLEYRNKLDLDADAFAELFIREVREFVTNKVWSRAARVLPSAISHFCGKVVHAKHKQADERLRTFADLWESTTRILFLCCLAIFDHFDVPVKPLLASAKGGWGKGRLENDPLLRGIEMADGLIPGILEARGYTVMAREFAKFFDASFLDASRRIQKVRNAQVHKQPMDETAAMLDTQRDAFFNFVVGASFWALHPLITNARPAEWETRWALRAQPLRGQEFDDSEFVVEFDFSTLVTQPDKLYQCILNPEDRQQALIVPLFPLIRIERREERDVLWLAHHPLKDEYRNPTTGKKRTFDDSELSSWWQARDA